MLNEKNLIKELKRAYKNEGYTVQRISQCFQIVTGYCAIAVVDDFMPRKVLGLLVEHIGEVPTEPWHVQKGQPPQKEFDGISAGIFEKPKDYQVSHKTGLTLDSNEVWQDDDLTCSLYDPDLTSIADLEEAAISLWHSDNKLRIDGGPECLIVEQLMNHSDVKLYELGKFQWWRD